MWLRYIGKDKSMGLINGRAYKVDIFSDGALIWVRWGERRACPYSSPETLAKNWIKAVR